MAAEVIAEGEAAGLGERALRRALKALGGWSEKPSMKPAGFGSCRSRRLKEVTKMTNERQRGELAI